MDNWKGTLLQVIGILLGSSVVLGFINNYISTLNHPEIEITVKSESLLEPPTFGEPWVVVYLTEIRNSGNLPATNIKLIQSFSNLNPISFSYFVSSTENFTDEDFEKYGNTIWGNLDKLGRGGEISIVSNFTIPTFSMDGSVYQFSDFSVSQTGCIVTLSYDQNTNKFYCSNTQSRGYLLEYPLLLFLGTSATIISILYIRKYKSNKGNKRKFNFISIIRNDVYKIYNVFNEDLYSSRIVTSDLWESLKEDERRQIFNNYIVYRKLNDFYIAIKNRDISLSYDVDDETLRVYNSMILNLVSDLLKIQWDDIYVTQLTVRKAIPAYLIMLLFSFSLSIVEILFTNFIVFSNPYFLLDLVYSEFLLVLWYSTFFILITYSTIILILIFKKTTNRDKSVYTISSGNTTKRLRELLYYKIILLSVAILGFPIGAILFYIYDFDFFKFFFDTSSLPPSYPYLITFSIIIANIGRAYVVFRIMADQNKEIKDQPKVFSNLDFLTGSLYIISGLVLLFWGNIIEVSQYNVLSFMIYVILALYFSFGILDIILGILFLRGRFISHKIGIITSSFMISIWFFLLMLVSSDSHFSIPMSLTYTIIGMVIIISKVYYVKKIRLDFS